MATRIGIELSPAACRIIEIDASPPWRRQPSETRVRSFAVLPPSGSETEAKLESLRKRRAAVVVWSGPSEHRQVMVTAGSYESMRGEALGALGAAGLPTRGVWADIAPASAATERAPRRPVVVSLASAEEMTAALQPLRDAGIRLRTVTTPAVALSSLARLRQAFSVPHAIEAYVALEEQVTCIALVRGGVLVAARDLAWGYLEEDDMRGEPRRREDIATRLGDAIGGFIAGIGGSPGDIGQVCVCGGLPELRSMTAPLMERLDVEVEPLDSMFGIDVASLPEPEDEFRERGAELRLAWAVTADWPPPINLLRARRRQVSKAVLGRVAVVTGVAAGLAVGWSVERSPWWRSTAPKPATRTATNVPARGRGPAPAPRAEPPAASTKPPVVTPPPVVATKPPVATPPPVVATKPRVATPPPVMATKPPVATPPPVMATKPPVATPPLVATTKPPVATPPPVATTKPPVATPPRVATTKPPVATPPPVVATKPPVATPPRVATTKPPVATPPLVATTKPPVATPPPVVATKPRVAPPPPVMATKPPVATPPPVMATKPPVATPPPVVATKPPVATPPPVVATKPPVATPPLVATTKPPVATPPPVVATKPPVATPPLVATTKPPVAPPPPRPAPQAAPPVQAPPPEVALPFDAVLGTILYSPDRKLAIVDGRIVGPGDEVRGARVVDITPNAVMLRDGQGRLRRLALGAGGR